MNGWIEGRIFDSSGRPVSGVTVMISASEQPHDDIAALTNAEGRFRLNNLMPGTYTLAAHRAQEAVEVEAVVAEGQPTQVEMRLHVE